MVRRLQGISDEEKDERGHKSSDETIWFGCDKLGTGVKVDETM